VSKAEGEAFANRMGTLFTGMWFPQQGCDV
jgi:hypothetical protein